MSAIDPCENAHFGCNEDQAVEAAKSGMAMQQRLLRQLESQRRQASQSERLAQADAKSMHQVCTVMCNMVPEYMVLFQA
jgi:hypothetical protein